MILLWTARGHETLTVQGKVVLVEREQAEIRGEMAGGTTTHHLAAGLADSCSCTPQSDVM